eukprot:CAMPEP_0194749348 /NCGR_PEP_ID=MMETSP0323_2-20130528/3549_1 /TAXON_ID=2866 ORGANISM="Crypthecodinium cohnii, Strain Seligo" /NCGR_SAMPLE_ID=MMETSP0323_2 /ASSEMBLY_ACC=CAM_ASM_000346 /LENGTH=572 /DNA_ID=CAMNT_0039664389 /DNA_START=15 /DNA_END=1733 /DNA_ORIENTATION=-
MPLYFRRANSFDPTKPRKPRSTEGREEAKAAAKMTSEEWKKKQAGMDKKWPAPAYMSKPHDHGATCYRDETYEVTTRWMAETKIAYRPHAKAPGSKSHVRYEKYSKAKTVGEALKLGSWPADWCWDYERGFIKVIGPVRDEPLDSSKITNEDETTDVDKAIWRWYLRELAKRHELTIEDLKGGCSGESLIMRAHRLLSQREARRILKDAEKEKRKITNDEVLTVLRKWSFGKNTNRVNVTPENQEWVWSDTLGLLRDRIGDIHLTPPTKTYPEVIGVLNKYLHDRIPPEMKSFRWTSINLNCNYAAKRHRDGNNFGPSAIQAFGDFEGGCLNYWPEDDRTCDKEEKMKAADSVKLNLKDGLCLFNGNCSHSVDDFKGERYSVVFFCVRCFNEAPQECKDQLRSVGALYPEPDADRYALLRPPRGYANKKEVEAKYKKKQSHKFYPCSKMDKADSPAAYPLLTISDRIAREWVTAKAGKAGAIVKVKGRKEAVPKKGAASQEKKAQAKAKSKAKAKAKADSPKGKASGGGADKAAAKSTPARKEKKEQLVTPGKTTKRAADTQDAAAAKKKTN